MKKQTFLILVGMGHKGQLFHTLESTSVETAFEDLTNYLKKNNFQEVHFDAELKSVWCFGWESGALITAEKMIDSQTFGCIYFNIETAKEWAL